MVQKTQYRGILIIIMAILSSFIVHSQGFGNCPFGDFPFGDCTLVGGGVRGGGGDGGGQINIPPTFAEVNLFGDEPTIIDGQPACKKGYQLFDNRCYPCDPETGYLQFNPDDRSILCVECNEDFTLNQTTKKCIPKERKIYIEILTRKISDTFKTPLVVIYTGIGFTLLLFGYYGIIWLKKREKEEKKPEEENDLAEEGRQ